MRCPRENGVYDSWRRGGLFAERDFPPGDILVVDEPWTSVAMHRARNVACERTKLLLTVGNLRQESALAVADHHGRQRWQCSRPVDGVFAPQRTVTFFGCAPFAPRAPPQERLDEVAQFGKHEANQQ